MRATKRNKEIESLLRQAWRLLDKAADVASDGYLDGRASEERSENYFETWGVIRKAKNLTHLARKKNRPGEIVGKPLFDDRDLEVKETEEEIALEERIDAEEITERARLGKTLRLGDPCRFRLPGGSIYSGRIACLDWGGNVLVRGDSEHPGEFVVEFKDVLPIEKETEAERRQREIEEEAHGPDLGGRPGKMGRLGR